MSKGWGERDPHLSVSLAGAHLNFHTRLTQPQAPHWLMSQEFWMLGYKERITVEKCWGLFFFKREKDLSLPQEPWGQLVWSRGIYWCYFCSDSAHLWLEGAWLRAGSVLCSGLGSCPLPRDQQVCASVCVLPEDQQDCASVCPATMGQSPGPGEAFPRAQGLCSVVASFFSSVEREGFPRGLKDCPLLAASPGSCWPPAICFTCFTRPGAWLGGPGVCSAPAGALPEAWVAGSYKKALAGGWERSLAWVSDLTACQECSEGATALPSGWRTASDTLPLSTARGICPRPLLAGHELDSNTGIFSSACGVSSWGEPARSFWRGVRSMRSITKAALFFDWVFWSTGLSAFSLATRVWTTADSTLSGGGSLCDKETWDLSGGLSEVWGLGPLVTSSFSGGGSLRPVGTGVFSSDWGLGLAAPMDLSSLGSAVPRGLSSGWDLTEGEELGPVTREGLSDSWGLGPATTGGLSNGFWLDTNDWGLVPDPARSLTLSTGCGLESVLSGGLSGSGGLWQVPARAFLDSDSDWLVSADSLSDILGPWAATPDDCSARWVLGPGGSGTGGGTYSRISPGSRGLGPQGSCSVQDRRPSSLEIKSIPSRCCLQKELGHISQKEAASFPHMSHWCQGHSHFPENTEVKHKLRKTKHA